MNLLQRLLDRALGGSRRREESNVKNNLENRIAAIEQRLAKMAGIILCDGCGGPVPYSAGILSERLHADGKFERLYASCAECHQAVDEDGRGTGRPRRIGMSVVEAVLFNEQESVMR